MSNVDLGPRKTVFIMVIVVGCFAVLWPKVFYPMYAGSLYNIQTKSHDKTEGCCDVIWETDVNAIRIINDLCGNILKELRETDPRIQLAFESGKLPNDIVEKCRSKVLSTCNVDIALFLKEHVSLGRTYRQMLDELRSINSSLCLKYNFGIMPDELGVRYRITIDSSRIQSVRQERPAHLHPEMLHPALRERGRAIPPSSSPSSSSQPRVVPGRPGPVPGMRPTLGGAGHVVPPPKATTSTMGIVMPIYTIGIVIFFTYTLMKIMFKKDEKSNAIYPPVQPDPSFHKRVFNKEYTVEKSRYTKLSKDDTPGSKLVVTALTDMLTEVDQRREALAKQRAAEQRSTNTTTSTVTHPQISELNLSPSDTNNYVQSNKTDITINGEPRNLSTKSTATDGKKESKENISDETKTKGENQIYKEEKAQIKVLGMEVTESCEGGKPWSRPSSPIAPPLHLSSSPETPPTPIMLETKVPPQAKILVSNSLTDKEVIEDSKIDDTDENEPAIMLSGKITLSVISTDDDKQESNDVEVQKETDIKNQKQIDQKDEKEDEEEEEIVEEIIEVEEEVEEEEEEEEEDEEEKEIKKENVEQKVENKKEKTKDEKQIEAEEEEEEEEEVEEDEEEEEEDENIKQRTENKRDDKNVEEEEEIEEVEEEEEVEVEEDEEL